MDTNTTTTQNPRDRKFRHKKHERSNPPAQVIRQPDLAPASCRICKILLPDIKPEKWKSYTCETCKKADKLKEHIDTLVSGGNKKDCLKAMNELDTMYDGTEVYPQYMAYVTYDKTTSIHSGYCSDPYDVDTKDIEKDEQVYLPLFRDFKNADIDLQNQITNHSKIDKYYSVPIGYRCCRRGSTKYTINSVEVVDKKPRVKLDD